MYENLDDVIHKIIDKISEKTPVDIVGASVQSCSRYLKINNNITVRISDHRATSSQISDVDYFLAIEIDGNLIVADDSLAVKKVYQTLETIFDENGEEVTTSWVDCDKHDDDAEHVGYKVSNEELNRVVNNIFFEAQF